MRIWNMQARQEVYQGPLLHANIRFYPDVYGTFAAMNRQDRRLRFSVAARRKNHDKTCMSLAYRVCS